MALTNPIERMDHRLPDVAADAWNLAYPIGTPVAFWPVAREGAGSASRTRSRAWVLGGHTAVVMVDGYAGGIALSHVDPSLREVAAALKADTPPEAPEDRLRELRHAVADLDPDSMCPLPGCTPACLPAGTEPPGGSDG